MAENYAYQDMPMDNRAAFRYEEQRMRELLNVNMGRDQYNELLRHVNDLKKGLEMADDAGNHAYHACHWEAGNPADGYVAPLLNQADDMPEKHLVELVRDVLHQNPKVTLHDADYTQWNKTSHMGIWLSMNSEKALYLEIQYKRISGADFPLGYVCCADPCRVLAKLKDIPIAEDDSNHGDEIQIDGDGKSQTVPGRSAKDTAATSAMAAADERIRKSWMYLVRVIAIPAPPGTSFNTFTGPRTKNRHYALLGEAGWVVPPLEERQALLKHRAAEYAPLKMRGYNRPLLHADVAWDAISGSSDWITSPMMFGEDPPVWLEVADPCKEDVYWLVWTILSGTQYKGFRRGVGFGMDRDDPVNTNIFAAVSKKNPFSSPSLAARRHSANCEL